MRKIFLTFGDSDMHRALVRIKKQAIAMNVYDQVVIANEFNLDIRFREKYSKYLVKGVRGYGYWIWKAQLILQTLEQMDDGDILHYADAGCHLNPKGRQRLLNYFSITQKGNSGILGFQAIPPSFHDPKIALPDLSEFKWCKGDLFDYFSVRFKKEITHSQTIGAGVIFISKCQESKDFINDWMRVYENGIHLVDDTPSISENINGFIEHRHDQAIFSILGKLKKIETVSAYEYWYPSKIFSILPNWGALKNYPVHTRRDKGVHLLLKPLYILLRIYRRVIFEIKKQLN